MPAFKPSFPDFQYSHPLAQGLQLAWPAYEGSGTFLRDVSPNQNGGNFQGGLTWSKGQSGYALTFNGSSTYVNSATSPLVNAFPSTLAAWFNATTISVGQCVLAVTGVLGTLNNQLMLYVNASNVLQARTFNTAGSNQSLTGPTISANTWYFAIASFQSTSYNMVVNGILYSFSPTAQTISSLTQTLLGRFAGSSPPNYWNGLIDSAYVWNRALSVPEMLQLYEDAYAPIRPHRRLIRRSPITSSVTVTDNIGIADSVSRFVNTFRSLTDSIGVADSFARLANGLRVFTEGIGIADSIARFANTFRSLTDNVGVADSVTRLANALRLSTEGIGVADSLARLANGLRQLTEGIGVADSVSRVATALRALTDALGIAESSGRLATTFRAVIDAAGIADSAAAQHATSVIVTDSLGIADSATGMAMFVRVKVEVTGGMADSGATPLAGRRTTGTYSEPEDLPAYQEYTSSGGFVLSGRTRVRLRSVRLRAYADFAPTEPLRKDHLVAISTPGWLAGTQTRFMDGVTLKRAQAADALLCDFLLTSLIYGQSARPLPKKGDHGVLSASL